MNALIERAAEAIVAADVLLFTAGAGMGVDSRLPDFRGTEGFWRAYPVYAALGLNWQELAQPRWFRNDPTLAWGFYGHRLNLYRAAAPHAGYSILRDWAAHAPQPSFVFTSNVDGHFARAGFDPERIEEVHGNIAWLQCTRPCGIPLFEADPAPVSVDHATMRAEYPLPMCPACGSLARPNILLFDDDGWDATRTDAQADRWWRWRSTLGGKRLTIVECGAGTAIPTIRYTSERVADGTQGTLIRINPLDSHVPAGQIAIARGALAALTDIAARVDALRPR